MYSIADSLRDEGIEQGIEQGRVEESQRILLRLLKKRFGLAESERAAVSRCTDTDNLEAAAERLVEPEATKDTVLGLLRNR